MGRTVTSHDHRPPLPPLLPLPPTVVATAAAAAAAQERMYIMEAALSAPPIPTIVPRHSTHSAHCTSTRVLEYTRYSRFRSTVTASQRERHTRPFKPLTLFIYPTTVFRLGCVFWLPTMRLDARHSLLTPPPNQVLRVFAKTSHWHVIPTLTVRLFVYV